MDIKIRRFDLPGISGILMLEWGQIHMVALVVEFRKDGLETFRSIFCPTLPIIIHTV